MKDIFEEYSLSTNVIYFCLSAATNHVQHNYVLKNLVPRLASLLCHSVLLVKGEPLGGKDLTGPICPSLSLNLTLYILDRPKPVGRAAVWRRVKKQIVDT